MTFFLFPAIFKGPLFNQAPFRENYITFLFSFLACPLCQPSANEQLFLFAQRKCKREANSQELTVSASRDFAFFRGEMV